jgi:hypothetical protein
MAKGKDLPAGWRRPSLRHISVRVYLLFVATCQDGDIALLSDKLSLLVSSQ